MNNGNPMAHLVKHLEFMTREAVLEEMVKVWEANQSQVRFESFLYRLLHLRRAHTQADFMLQASELVLWFGKETPYEKSVPHTVSGGILGSYLIKSSGKLIEALTDLGQRWRVDVQPTAFRVQVSEPELNWRGSIFPWQKVVDVVDMLDKKPRWKSAVYIKAFDEPHQVMWLNPIERVMSICTLQGGCVVNTIEYIQKVRAKQHPFFSEAKTCAVSI